MKETKTNGEKYSPEKILETAFAYATTRVLLTGIDLEVFTHIANGNNSTEDIANMTSSNKRGIEILLNSLTSLGFIEKRDNKYFLTPISDNFLVKGKPAYHGDFVQHIDSLWEPWGRLTDIVKTGKPFQRVEKQGIEFFQKFVPQLFQMSYPCARVAAEELGVGNTWNNLNILDAAAGSGAWSIAFAERDPGTRVVAQDFPEVLDVTRQFVEKFNLGQRYDYLPGDLNDVDLGNNMYDLIILGHICHSEGEKNSQRLISRSYVALKNGGKLLIADMIPDEERSSAVFPLLFAVNMLVNTTEGNTFTMKEYDSWLKDAGFSSVSSINVPGASPLIIADK